MKMFKKKIKSSDIMLNSDIEELKNYDINSEERKALINEISVLKDASSVQNESSNKRREALMKAGLTVGLILVVAGIDKSCILNKNLMTFIPKHI